MTSKLKSIAKKLVVAILAWQVKRLRKQDFKIIGIVGSYGKTSTKFIVAELLQQNCRVRYQPGNYNDLVSVPLIFFNQPLPSLFNPLKWLMVFVKNERQILKKYPFDVVVVELGTDGPNQISQFQKYLRLDYAILTAIGYEHMENFKDIQAVADEELSVMQYSRVLIYNSDLVSKKYLDNYQARTISYGFNESADYTILNTGLDDKLLSFKINKNNQKILTAQTSLLANFQLYSICAATIVCELFGLSLADLKQSVSQLQPVSGRMQLITGKANCLIIDDSYNASPDAMKAALDFLYSLKNTNKIAVLGNMNELGDYSAQAHYAIGQYCQPNQLNLVITIGSDANSHLARAARKTGCQVESFQSPFLAGEYILKHLQPNTAILFKGSQNGVFTEEAIKPLLLDSQDQLKLVRQSKTWLNKKQAQFNLVSTDL